MPAPYLSYFLGVFFAYLIGQASFSLYLFLKSRKLARQSFSGRKEYGNKSRETLKVFLAGDSIPAGEGASSFKTSLSGRLVESFSNGRHLIFTNAAKSGSRVRDLKKFPSGKQDLSIVFIASNDLLHFTNLGKFEKDLRGALAKFAKMSKKVVLIGPGNIGKATMIPLFMKPLYAFYWPKYTSIMRSVSSGYPNVAYIDPRKYIRRAESYGRIEAEDGFHPNDNGHKFWADLILSKALRQKREIHI